MDFGGYKGVKFVLIHKYAGLRPLITGSSARMGGGVYCEIIEGASLFHEEMTIVIFQFANAIELY